MAFNLNILVIGLLGTLVVGCGMSRRTFAPTLELESRSRALRAVAGHTETRASLMQAYSEWKGTPYLLGGASPDGVDCSSFVRIVFDDYFGIKLPPNTTTQLNAGTGIRRTSLRTGDLVFFRTGRKTLHVGIIVKDDEFMHASTSRGVMISRLSEHYWSSRYLAARRVM
jgi:cell wall-associated NlpC family hydrolase